MDLYLNNVPNYSKNFIFKPVDVFFRTYTYHDLDLYAKGKRNGLWKGRRMFVNEQNN